MSEVNRRLEEADTLVVEARAKADQVSHDATRNARQVLDDAEAKAAEIVNEAKQMASKVRADSERELAAATQRRDSINAQLGNVRQMLATLTGSSAVSLEAFDASLEQLTPEDSVQEVAGAEGAEDTDEAAPEDGDGADEGAEAVASSEEGAEAAEEAAEASDDEIPAQAEGSAAEDAEGVEDAEDDEDVSALEEMFEASSDRP
jgi:vacuolar-type H+-ATPase subunit H